MTVVALAPAFISWIYPSLAVACLSAAAFGVLLARYSGDRLSRLLAPLCLTWLAFQELYPCRWHGPQPGDVMAPL